MKFLQETLDQVGKIDPNILLALTGFIKPVKFKKDVVISKIGEICNHIFFMESGFARGSYLNKGKETTSWFWKEGDFVTSFDSLLGRKPSIENIIAVEDCSGFVLSYENLQSLYTDYPHFNLIGRKLTEKAFMDLGEVVAVLRNVSAAERHASLLSRHPEIYRRAHQQHIASYLGISPETLSRIRSKSNS